MKGIISCFVLLFATTIANAQTDSISKLYNRLSQLEDLVNRQALQINKLTSDVSEVTKQNLALKKNLNLRPTLAQYKEDNLMDYRVVEVSGNSKTGEVNIIITAENIGTEDLELLASRIQIVDELGNGYDETNKNSIIISGASDNLKGLAVNFHPKTPYRINLNLFEVSPDVQYIKYLEIKFFNVRHSHKIYFENLPIKWQSNE